MCHFISKLFHLLRQRHDSIFPELGIYVGNDLV